MKNFGLVDEIWKYEINENGSGSVRMKEKNYHWRGPGLVKGVSEWEGKALAVSQARWLPFGN